MRDICDPLPFNDFFQCKKAPTDGVCCPNLNKRYIGAFSTPAIWRVLPVQSLTHYDIWSNLLLIRDTWMIFNTALCKGMIKNHLFLSHATVNLHSFPYGFFRQKSSWEHDNISHWLLHTAQGPVGRKKSALICLFSVPYPPWACLNSFPWANSRDHRVSEPTSNIHLTC